MSKVFLKTVLISLMILFVLVPSVVPILATDANVTNALYPCNNGNCTFQDLVSATQEFAKRIVQIGLVLAPLILAYVGWLLITSGDNPGNRKKAKDIGWNVVTGLAYMMLAWVVVNLILTALVCGSTSGNWFVATPGCYKGK